MKEKIIKKTKTKVKNINQLELTFLENEKNKKDINYQYNKSFNAISRIFLSSLMIVSFFLHYSNFYKFC